MHLNRIVINELDYFDFLRLDGKPAISRSAQSGSSFPAKAIQYDFEPGQMKCSDVDVSEKPEAISKELKENSVPLNTLDLREEGRFRLLNLHDEFWLFAFASGTKNICLIRTGSFEKTIGEM